MSDTFYQIIGCIGFAALIATIVAGQRVVGRFQNRARARALAPLAAAIDATVEHRNPNDAPAIVAQYQGRKLRAYCSPKTAAGYGESALTINAFSIVVADVSGAQAWTARFHVTGLLGQGVRELHIECADRALAERLIDAGLLDALQAFCAATADYVAATYDPQNRLLTLTDDVMPRVLPTADSFVRQTALALKVAGWNETSNTSAV
jgi:hypothetical protein